MAFVNAADQKSATPTHTEAIFFITEDPKHNAAAVSTFMNITNTTKKIIKSKVRCFLPNAVHRLAAIVKHSATTAVKGPNKN